MRMGELGGDRDLPGEPLLPDLGAELRAQRLQGDGTPVLAVPRQIDGGGAAAAQLTLDDVAVGEGGVEGGDGVGHDRDDTASAVPGNTGAGPRVLEHDARIPPPVRGLRLSSLP